MTYQDCPFCNKSILLHSFLESKNYRAIYNISPVLPGHSLVIPKKHITSFMALSDTELFEFMTFSRKVIQLLNLAFNTEGFNWTIQEKEEAGQTIDHMHMHIIPRKSQDLKTPGEWYPKLKQIMDIDSSERPKLSKEEMAKTISFLKQTSKDIFH